MADPINISDGILMARIRRGDQRALGYLYDKYGSLVYSLARHILQDNGMAEEIAQDTFLRVWRNASAWNEERGKLISWLLTMTRYAAIDRLRKEQRRPHRSASSIEDSHDLIPDATLTGESAYLNAQALKRLEGQLPREQQDMIRLAYYQGMSHSEIAAHTTLPLGTVKTRLRLAMQRLRVLWREQSELE